MSDPTPAPDCSSPDVAALRPFVPATNFEASLSFYGDLGFTVHRIADGLASIELGPFAFLLQHFYAENFAGNFMMQLLSHDLASWWKRIDGLDLAAKYGVRAPRAPAVQPWGLTVAYVVDPSGVLWHFVQKPG